MQPKIQLVKTFKFFMKETFPNCLFLSDWLEQNFSFQIGDVIIKDREKADNIIILLISYFYCQAQVQSPKSKSQDQKDLGWHYNHMGHHHPTTHPITFKHEGLLW